MVRFKNIYTVLFGQSPNIHLLSQVPPKADESENLRQGIFVMGSALALCPADISLKGEMSELIKGYLFMLMSYTP